MPFTILCPTDFSEASERALSYAIENFAQGDCEIVLLHVDDLPSYGLPEGSFLDDPMRDAWRLRLEKIVEEHTGEARMTVATRRGRPSAEILAHAKEIDADLIVLSTRGRSALGRMLLGAVAHKIVRGSPVPVVSVDPEAKLNPVRRILCPVDFSAASEVAFAEAVAVAARRDAEIHLLYALRLPRDYVLPDGTALFDSGAAAQAREQARAELKALAERFPNAKVASMEVRDGLPHVMIRERAKEVEADLVVMGTHGRSPLWRFLLGSVAERTVRSATVPVMVVRDETPPEG